MSKLFNISPGMPYPTGVRLKTGGVNFSIFSRHATRVELLLFEDVDSLDPFQVLELQPLVNKTFFSWHIFVEDFPVGGCYSWRMDGPNNAHETGLRFDKDKHLLDPWALAVSDKLWDRKRACEPGDNGHTAMRSLVVDNEYDWEGDEPLLFKSENSIIYELHVGGFTRHPSSKVKHPASFAGLIEKIPYLQSLGITHVELLPIMAFDEQDVPKHTAELGLENYWGYSTHSFFSPHPGYCVTPDQGTHLREFRDLVKALHKANIGVILDVVFNHTSEAGIDGPIMNFKGIDNSVFYHLGEHDKSIFVDYTGCGNSVNANHPIVANYIIDCLEYWVREMHVDGFRFDLASALARGEHGEVLHDPPVLWGVELSVPLAKSKLIAEAWDAVGLYQVGSFPGLRWAEWNGRYRDVIRRFIRGDKGMISELATRMSGNSDLYKHQGRLPINSINFVTCHDGFTLNDLVSYNQKHNQDNGENNQDGCNNNLSFNCGVEGPTTDSEILALRTKKVKNVFTILMISQGVPMLLAGDEVLATQHGNNNGYCQNNDSTWFDWELTKKHKHILRFVQGMIALRKRHPALRRRRFLTGQAAENDTRPDISWHSATGVAIDWESDDLPVLAFSLLGVEEGEADLYAMMNMSDATVNMQLPFIQGQSWFIAADTALDSPQDIIQPEDQTPVYTQIFSVQSHAIVIFEGIWQT